MSGGWWVGEGRRQIYGGWRSEQYTGAGNQYTGAGVGGGAVRDLEHRKDVRVERAKGR